MQLLYFTDPMCSWCYGFGPVIEEVAAHYRDSIPLITIAGGLRPFNTKPMNEMLAREVTHHWHQVQQASGQPFDFDFFGNHRGFVYDTAPACQALVVVREWQDKQVLPFLHALQSRFYAGGQDPTQLDTFSGAAEDVGLDPDAFASRYLDPDAAEHTRADFERARASGVMGYPTLKLELNGRLRLLASGYTGFDQITDVATAVIKRYGD